MRYGPGDFVLGLEATTDGEVEARVCLAKGKRWPSRRSLQILRQAIARPLGISEVNIADGDEAGNRELFNLILPEHIGEDEAEAKMCLAIARTAPKLRSFKPYRKVSKPGSRHVNRLHTARSAA